MAYIGKQPTIGNFQKCDAISVVNGQAAYTMQVGSVNVNPESENHMIVSLNGIIQSPVDSFTISGSTITFASNLSTGDVIDFIMILGNVLDLGVPSDNTVSLAKLTATGTKDATTFLRGDNTFAGAGISEADMFRLTADISNPSGDVTSNLERVDDATFSKIGTGMTESSGIFTFPSTGLYMVTQSAQINVNSDAFVGIQMNVSTDSGSSYNNISNTADGITSGSTNSTSTISAFINVTNATTFRVKFSYQSFASATVKGDTAQTETAFTFIKLGGSQ